MELKKLEKSEKAAEKELIVFEIKCKFCGVVGGKVEFEKGKEPKTFMELGIADHRCDACRIKFGKYKQ